MPSPLRKALDAAADLPIRRFPRITVGPGLSELTQEVKQDLSTDQRYGYELVNAIRTGKLSAEIARLEVGPVCHSRWLTTANRFLRLWVGQHGLSGKTKRNMRLIVEYIVGVCYPTCTEGAPICLQQLQLADTAAEPGGGGNRLPAP